MLSFGFQGKTMQARRALHGRCRSTGRYLTPLFRDDVTATAAPLHGKQQVTSSQCLWSSSRPPMLLPSQPDGPAAD